MDGTPTGLAISRTLDKLFDRGTVDGEWENVDGCWTHTSEVIGASSDVGVSVAVAMGCPALSCADEATGKDGEW